MRARLDPPPLPLPAYTGRYTHPSFGSVEIREQDGILLCVRTPEQILEFVPESDETFLARYRNEAEDLHSGKVTIEFSMEDGRPTGFTKDEILSFVRVPQP